MRASGSVLGWSVNAEGGMGDGRIRAVVAAGAVMGTLVLTAAVAWAAPSVSTRYPAVDVAAGEQVNFDLSVSASPGEQVELAVTDAPEGWDTALRAGGFNVRAVTPEPDGPAQVTLEVTVPPDAAEGSHQVTVEASSPTGTDVLTVDLRITEAARSAVSLETEFATLQGGAEDTFTYSVNLSNDTPQETTFALAAAGTQGWQVSANPSTQARANTVTVAAGGTATISVEATPPPGVSAGEYPIGLQVTGGGQTAQIELVAEVTGSSQLAISTASERLDASGVAGRATTITLVVSNPGSAPLTDVALSASPPSDWEVTFEPPTIQSVPSGESVQVQATVTPAGEAVVGDYAITVTASSEQRRENIELRFSVGTSGAWGVASVSAIALVFLGLFAVFRRYGRR